MNWLKGKLASRWLHLLDFDQLSEWVKQEQIRRSADEYYRKLTEQILSNFPKHNQQINLSGYDMSCNCGAFLFPHKHEVGEFKTDKHLTDIRKK